MSDAQLSIELQLATGQFISAAKEAQAALDGAMGGIKASAESTGAAVDAAFAKLGIRSDAAITADIEGLKAAFQSLAESADVSAAELQKAESAMAEGMAGLKAELGGIPAAAHESETGFAALGGAVSELMLEFMAFETLKSVAEAMLETALEADRLHASLTNISGSAKAAEDDLNYLHGISNDLGVDFVSAAEAFVRLAAASKGTALEGAATRDIFESVAQAGSAMNLTTAQMSHALEALGLMFSMGGVQAVALRKELGTALPGAFAAMARANGLTNAQLSELMKQGNAGLEMLPKFAAELNKTYAGANLDGMAQNVNRLGNVWHDLKESMVNSYGINLAVQEITWKLEVMASVVETVSGAYKNFYKNLFDLFSSAKDMAQDFAASVKEAFQPLSVGVNAVLQAADAQFASLQKSSEEFLKTMAKDTDNTAKAMSDAFASHLGLIKDGLDGRLQSIENTEQAERDGLQQTTQAYTQATQIRLQTIDDYRREAEPKLQASYAAQIELARLAGQDTTAVEQASINARIALYGQLEDGYKQTVDALVAEENRLAQAVLQTAQAREDLETSLQDRIRNVQQGGMTAYQAYQDKLREVDEKESAARQALAQGDYELAIKLSQQAGQIAESTAKKVVDNKNEVVSQAQAAQTAIQEMTEAGSIQDQALADRQKSQQDAASALGDAAGTATAKLTETQLALASLRAEGEKALDLKLTVDTDAAQKSIDQFKALQSVEDNAVKIRAILQGANPEESTAQIAQLVKNLNEAAAAAKIEVPLSLQPNQAFAAIAEVRRLASEKTEADHQVVLANRTEVEQFIATLQLPTQSTHTVNVVTSGGEMPGYATGGEIRGPGGGDVIPLLASDGEYIINRHAVNRFGLGFMHAINAGRMPSYAGGGAVGDGAGWPGQAGADSAGAAGRILDTVNINLSVGSQSFQLQSARDQAMGLAKALRDISRG